MPQDLRSPPAALRVCRRHTLWPKFVLLTRDEDFVGMTVLRGAPPKVVWLNVGNARNAAIVNFCRRGSARSNWAEADLHRRLGENADTFAEFVARVRRFRARLDTLADNSVIFGHGIWLALLHWQLQGQEVTDTAGMRAFREFQLQLPMPNCAMFTIAPAARDQYRMEYQPVADLQRQRGA